MKSHYTVSVERIKELLDYDERTGELLWRWRDPSSHRLPRWVKSFNTRHAGKRAGNTYYQSGHKHTKYIKLGIDSRDYDAHRVAWAHYYGEWPSGNIDHIDGNGTNNKIENLRCVSQTVNCRNAKLRNDNKYGVCGVIFDKSRCKWKAEIAGTNLGRFETLFDAVACRRSAERKMGFSDRHGLK